MELPTPSQSSSPESLKPKYIEIVPPKKEKHLRAGISLIVFLLVLAALSFGGGWATSLVKERFLTSPAEIQRSRTASASAERSGWNVYEDKDAGFSVYYPDDWKFEKHDAGKAVGGKISLENSSVEFWLKIDQTVALNEEQRSGLKTSETKSVEIDNKPAQLTTYEYQAGNFFVVTIYPATETQSQVSFWTHAADDEIKEITDKIVASFTFN